VSEEPVAFVFSAEEFFTLRMEAAGSAKTLVCLDGRLGSLLWGYHPVAPRPIASGF
jgi:hypothetical protein